MFASLMSELGAGSGSGSCCSEPETYPILAKYRSTKYCSMVSSKELCVSARSEVRP